MQSANATITFYTLYRQLILPLHILSKIRETQNALELQALDAPCCCEVPPIALQFTATLRSLTRCEQVTIQATIRPRSPLSLSSPRPGLDDLLCALSHVACPHLTQLGRPRGS